MTLLRAAKPPAGAFGGAPHYRRGFVVQVHRLLAAAYDRLSPANLADEEETVITGLLVTAMRESIEGPKRLAWASRFAVHDDPPRPTAGREGKARARLDIVVERTQPGRHPRFSFEAKRLYRSDSVAAYVGDSGLGAFVREYYAAADDAAGMLGYIQTSDVADWPARIADKLASDRVSHGLGEDVPVWTRVAVAECDLLSYESRHQRSSSPLLIIHTFLSCC